MIIEITFRNWCFHSSKFISTLVPNKIIAWATNENINILLIADFFWNRRNKTCASLRDVCGNKHTTECIEKKLRSQNWRRPRMLPTLAGRSFAILGLSSGSLTQEVGRSTQLHQIERPSNALTRIQTEIQEVAEPWRFHHPTLHDSTLKLRRLRFLSSLGEVDFALIGLVRLLSGFLSEEPAFAKLRLNASITIPQFLSIAENN